jgi:hypothetical protein
MRVLLVVITLIIAGAALAGPASASWVGLYTDTGGNDPQVVSPAYVTGQIHVVINAFEPINGVAFRIDGNSEWDSKAIVVGGDYLGFDHTGDPFSGVYIDFGQCLTGVIHVMTIEYLPVAEIECAQLYVLEFPNENNIQMTLCAGGTISAGGLIGYVRTQPPHYSMRLPADGATDVPTDVQLQWHESYCYEGLADCFGGNCSAVYFGTDPENLTENLCSISATSFDPGDLEPYTTYSWYLSTWYVFDHTVWSFTTGEGPTATQESTWGRIKSLYR